MVDIAQSLSARGITGELRPDVTLLFHATRTGLARSGVAAGLYRFKVSCGQDGKWNGASVTIQVTDEITGLVTYSPTFTSDAVADMTLINRSTVQAIVFGEAFGLHARLVPPGRNLDPTKYWRDIRVAGVTSTDYADPDSGKLSIGDYKYFSSTVGKKHCQMQLYDENTKSFARQFRIEVNPGDIPPKYNFNDRSELKTEFNDATNDYRYCFPFDTEIWSAMTLIFEPGPPLQGQWHILWQDHAAEDAGDAHLSPPLYIDFTPQGDGTEFIGIGSRTDPNPVQTSQPTTRTHYGALAQRAVEIPVVIMRKYNWQGQGALKFWIGAGATLGNPTFSSGSNFSLGYNDQHGPHNAFGIYQANLGDQNSSFYSPEIVRWAYQLANPEQVAGTNALAARVGNPLPLPLSAAEQFA